MKIQNMERWASRGLLIVLVLTAFLCAFELVLGFQWRMQHDTPLLHYVAFLMDRHGYVPYRDVFETSMAGGFFFHLLVGKLFGYGDIAFRFVDALVWAAIVGTAWAALSRFGGRVALLAALLFGLFYFSKGPTMSLQRDYLAILPIVASLAIAAQSGRRNEIKSLVVGALFAIAALIKPQLAIGLPIILGYLFVEATDRAPRSRLASFLLLAGPACASFAIILALALLWLWQAGGLPAFIDILSRYLPLHLQLNGEHEVVASAERVSHLAGSWWSHIARYAPFILFGLYAVWSRTGADKKQRNLVITLGALTAAYSLTPVLAGQFWDYHWMPFDFFAVLCATLSVTLLLDQAAPFWKRVPALLAFGIVFSFVGLKSLTYFVDQLSGGLPAPNGGRVDEVARFLEAADLGRDDRVQPLDWTGGAVHAMLLAEARPATRFIYNYHFYHHISEPYIQALRSEFLRDLAAIPPRFIVDVSASSQPKGPGTTTEFPALSVFISQNYKVVQRGDAYTIFEKIAPQSPVR